MTQHLSEAEQEQIIARIQEIHPDATLRFDGDKAIVIVGNDESIVPILPPDVLLAMDRPRQVLILPPLKRPNFFRLPASAYSTKSKYDPCPCNSGKKFKFCCMGKS